MAISIYVVEDHPVMREMLVLYIREETTFKLSGVASSAEEALEDLPGCNVDLILCDMSLPQMNGLELIGEIKQRWPDMRCLIHSGHQNGAYAQRALDAGAHGYLLKGNSDELMHAIEEVLAGKVYVSDLVG